MPHFIEHGLEIALVESDGIAFEALAELCLQPERSTRNRAVRPVVEEREGGVE
jgi:hypothetical protein